jgi:2-keto-3-deoxy-6-phosphogluconate aldolase
MPRLRQNDRERAVDMIQAGMTFDGGIQMTALIVLDPQAEKHLMELANTKSTNLHRGILAPGEINLKHTY